MIGDPPWWDIFLRSVAFLAGLFSALAVFSVDMLIANYGVSPDVGFLPSLVPALVLLVGALLVLLKPGWPVVAFILGGVLATLTVVGVYGLALSLPALFLVPGLLSE